ncbi:elongation factor P hydroxylase [Psychrobacter urativorans]|uniref:Uncharacterized protein n=1 Tax=Psychrobacter urativorans TaxID=45610 RepID=A0A0M5TIW5_9GAMM|nr:elongation factor P hydroxylase [Psychrobacter urativorans]ALF59262.1 hypothetical protein AOC03_03690 [Psychrobacter urativorans]
MISNTAHLDFTQLLSNGNEKLLLDRLSELNTQTIKEFDEIIISQFNKNLKTIEQPSAALTNIEPLQKNQIDANILAEQREQAATEWLISLFNTLFTRHNVQLVRGEHEPEYFPECHSKPARIEFAHGFFASALHEISHWCIAGSKRRQLADFGYWYAPDGRSAAQQQAFERVEIKPQALECLFTLACRRQFQISQDNLFANFDTSTSTFATDVYQQAAHYIAQPHQLPRDAQTLLQALLMINIIE